MLRLATQSTKRLSTATAYLNGTIPAIIPRITITSNVRYNTHYTRQTITENGISKPGCNCTDKKKMPSEKELRPRGPLEERVSEKITSELNPIELIIRNDSWKHAHHSGMKGAENITESHFHVTIVSDKFAEPSLKSALARHRFIFKLLADEVKQIHGFQVVCKTSAEWAKLQEHQETRNKESSAKYFN